MKVENTYTIATRTEGTNIYVTFRTRRNFRSALLRKGVKTFAFGLLVYKDDKLVAKALGNVHQTRRIPENLTETLKVSVPEESDYDIKAVVVAEPEKVV